MARHGHILEKTIANTDQKKIAEHNQLLNLIYT